MNIKRLKLTSKTICHEVFNDKKIWICLAIALLATLLTNWVFSPEEHTFAYSINELAKNVGYSLVACVIFFVINDVITNTGKKIEVYNDLYQELYSVWLKSYQLEHFLRGYTFEKNLEPKERILTILNHMMTKEDFEALNTDDFTKNWGKQISVSADSMSVVSVCGEELKSLLDNFLTVYGSTLEHQEYYRLRCVNLDYAIKSAHEILCVGNQADPMRKIRTLYMTLNAAIFPYLELKDVLTEIANRYNKYYYSEKRGIRADVI